MTTTRRITSAVFCVLVVGVGVGACSNQDSSTSSSGGTASVSPTASTTSAVCADVTALRGSAEKIKAAKVGQGGLETLSTELTAMQTTLKQLASDTSTQYSGEIDAIKAAGNNLDASIRTAKRSPSAQALADVGADVRALGVAVRSLTATVGGTC